MIITRNTDCFGAGPCVVCVVAATIIAIISPARAQTVSLVLSNDAALKAPGYLTTDGTNLFVTGVSPDNSQHVFVVSPLGGAATALFTAGGPQQITLAGANIFWIDPNSGPITDMQILEAAANGSGPVTAIYTGSNVGQPIVDGSGMASDGILLYAADEVAGTVWRMKLDGSALTQVGPARYSGGFGPEHLNTVAVSQGVIYLADHGSSGSGIFPAVVSISTNGGSFTTLASGSPLVTPSGIAVGNGSVYISDPGAGNTIWQLPIGGGTPVALISGGVFKQIQGLCFLNGNLYVADNTAGAIYSITAAELSLLSLNMYAGLTIVGQVGATYEIDYLNSLSGGTNWTVLTNIVLPSNPYLFFDTTSPFSSSRFYRASKQ
jgi:hypothetical protein